MENKILFLFVLILMTTLMACNSPLPSSNNVNEEQSNTVDIEASNKPNNDQEQINQREDVQEIEEDNEVVQVPEPLIENVEEIPRDVLAENEFYPDLLKVGQQIVNLNVESIEFETLDVNSYIINFSGELVLEGEVKYITSEERTEETYDIYLTVSQETLSKLPRKKQDDMNFPVILAVPNGNKVLEGLSSNKIKARFENLTLTLSPTKPAESTIEIVELLDQ